MRLSIGLLAGVLTPLATSGSAGWPHAVRAMLDAFRARARARASRRRPIRAVMRGLKPDTEVFELNRSQPEFGRKAWQYLNRRVSDWRIPPARKGDGICRPFTR